MLLHIGGDISVSLTQLICVLNARGISDDSRRCIERARQEHRYQGCAGTARSYLLVNGYGGREMVYESPIAAATLQKRWRSACLHEQIEALAVLSVTAAE